MTTEQGGTTSQTPKDESHPSVSITPRKVGQGRVRLLLWGMLLNVLLTSAGGVALYAFFVKNHTRFAGNLGDCAFWSAGILALFSLSFQAIMAGVPFLWRYQNFSRRDDSPPREGAIRRRVFTAGTMILSVVFVAIGFTNNIFSDNNPSGLPVGAFEIANLLFAGALGSMLAHRGLVIMTPVGESPIVEVGRRKRELRVLGWTDSMVFVAGVVEMFGLARLMGNRSLLHLVPADATGIAVGAGVPFSLLLSVPTVAARARLNSVSEDSSDALDDTRSILRDLLPLTAALLSIFLRN